MPLQSGTSSNAYGIIGTGTPNGGGVSAHPGDSLIIDSNIVTGGGYGIVVYGATSAANNRGLRIFDNKIVSANYMGIYAAYNYNPLDIMNNDIMIYTINDINIYTIIYRNMFELLLFSILVGGLVYCYYYDE